uniref:SCAN box domain-containing protein n=1 Tax=Pseudonaja textilis TaxID=8673 RepID=A0A670ZHY8_PSETE
WKAGSGSQDRQHPPRTKGNLAQRDNSAGRPSGEALRMEMQRQHFRQFCCQEVADPRRIHSQLQELCRQWLRPERRTKEQILELLILEQFLASLPPELRSWIQARRPESCSQAVALVEDFLRSQEQTKLTWKVSIKECTIFSCQLTAFVLYSGKIPQVAKWACFQLPEPRGGRCSDPNLVPRKQTQNRGNSKTF